MFHVKGEITIMEKNLFKKVIAVCMAAVMSVMICACQQDNSNEANKDNASDTVTSADKENSKSESITESGNKADSKTDTKADSEDIKESGNDSGNADVNVSESDLSSEPVSGDSYAPVKPGKQGGCNLEYKYIGYSNEGDAEITYLDGTESYIWTYQMILMTNYSKKTTEVWTSCLSDNQMQSYGIRPQDSLTGKLEDWIEYDREGVPGGVRNLYLYYDYDSPVIEDLDFHTKYYFTRDGEPWEWGN